MKPLYALLFFVLFTFYGNAQIVDIPDANFKAALIADGVDTNGDGEIQVSEAELVDWLNVSDSNISDLTGISNFVNLTDLYCSGNQLTLLDISNLSSLFSLVGDNNQIETFISGVHNNLEQIELNGNQLTSFDISGLNSLSVLWLNDNQFTTLDVSGSNNLTWLWLNDNQLVSLNITNCPNLYEIICINNSLTTLDLTGVGVFSTNGPNINCDVNNISSFLFPTGYQISNLYASVNQIVNLDLSNVAITQNGDFSDNPLQTVNVKNGYQGDFSNLFLDFASGEASTIQFICADENELEDIINDYNVVLNDIPVSSYCTFEPGGDYNRITGSVRLDLDSNGCDASDTIIPNIFMEIDDGTEQGYVAVNQIGEYNAYVGIGDYTITPSFENASWYMATPSTASASFVEYNNVLVKDFCLVPVGVHQDVEVTIVPIISAQPGFNATYQIIYKNKGNQIASGDIELTYDDAVLDYISSSDGPTSLTTGSLVWNYTNLNLFESRSITVTLNVNSPMETPAVNIGDQLDFNAIINPIAIDEIAIDNQFNYKQTVVGSYDPNDITCLEGDTVSPDKIGEYLHYNINFENTGTAAATFVVVKDVIDETNFDISSLQIMYASHEMQTRVIDNTIEFIFDNINLGPEEKGNVVFKIKTNNTLTVGDSVENDAEIFFDYNFPIETNIATTSFQALSLDEFENDDAILVFPNPSKDRVTLSSKSNLKSIQVYDAMSRLVFETSMNDSNYTLNVSDYSEGIYFLKIKTAYGEQVERFIKN